MTEVSKIELPEKCFVCSNTEIIHIPTRNPQYHHEYGDEIFLDRQIFHCDQCQFSFCYPFVPEDDLSTFYSTGFVKRRRSWITWQRTWIKDLAMNKQPDLGSLVKLILAKQYIDINQIHNVCEIGGANVSTLETWRNCGLNAEYFSLESPGLDNKIFKDHGINTVIADITQGDSVEKTDFFDIVLSNHVLEHFNANKLNIVVENIYSIMRSGALFIFDVPHDDLSSFVDIGIRNQGCHLVYYQPKSLQILLQNAGFEILYLERTGPDKVALDNYPYPEGDFKSNKTEDKMYWDLINNVSPTTSNFKKAIKKYVPLVSQMLYMRNTVRIFKNAYTIRDLLLHDYLNSNPNGSNIKVCCRKPQL